MDSQLFIENRKRLVEQLPARSLAVLNANDIPVTNADGSLRLVPNSDLFYLSGVEQEQSILALFPGAHDEKQREILFIRDPNPDLAIWEGHKLTIEEARAVSGIKNVQPLSEWPRLFHRMMCECERVYLNSNEHNRATIDVETRDARFVAETQRKYPLHHYERLAPLMHRLRAVKSTRELEIIRKAVKVTNQAFTRVLKLVRPGVNEAEIEAEFAHEFIRNRARFAYTPIIASGKNSCVLHYIVNDHVCRGGDLLLLDVAANYGNYNADLTRTIPVNGKFTPRQKQVYNAVLRAIRSLTDALKPGKHWKDWQKEAEQLIEKECVDLGLLKPAQIRKQDPDRPAVKKYFMHGIGHPLGLDVHDVAITTKPMQAGWVMTVEPGIYIPEEGFGVRLENDIVIGESANTNLMADIPIDPGEIEAAMRRRSSHR